MPKLNSTIKARLLKRITKDRVTKCWNWQGTVSGGKYGGYAMIKINWKNRLASRISHEIFIGPIPKKFVVMHSCDNAVRRQNET